MSSRLRNRDEDMNRVRARRSRQKKGDYLAIISLTERQVTMCAFTNV